MAYIRNGNSDYGCSNEKQLMALSAGANVTMPAFISGLMATPQSLKMPKRPRDLSYKVHIYDHENDKGQCRDGHERAVSKIPP